MAGLLCELNLLSLGLSWFDRMHSLSCLLHGFQNWLEFLFDNVAIFLGDRLSLDWSDCDWDYGAPTLNSHSLAFNERYWVSHKDYSSKLRIVVVYIEAIFTLSNHCMAATHWDVINSDFAFMTSADFEFCSPLGKGNHMNHSRGILIQRQWLKHQIAFWSLGDFLALDYALTKLGDR